MNWLTAKLSLHWPLLLVFLSVLLLFRPIFSGKLPVPADTLVGLYHPYRDYYAQDYPSGIPYKNFLLTDPILQQIPWKYFAINQLKQGNLPWWNPHTHSGMPLLANLQAGVFYPLNFIFWLFDFPIAWTVYILIQPILGSLFLYLFLRHHHLHPLSCALGSLSWALGGFFMAWLEWGNIGHTLLWLPLCLLLIDKYLTSQKKIYLFLNTLALSFSFFAGHLQLFFYIFLTTTTYFTWKTLLSKTALKEILSLAISYVLLAAVIAPQLLSTLQLIKLSTREIDQIHIFVRPDWFLPWQHLAQFIAPDFFGNPATLNYFGVWNYAEFIGYIGIIGLCFALISVFNKNKSPLRWFSIALVLTGIVFTLPTPIAKLPFILKLPLVSFAQPSRLIALVSFGFSVLAALGLDQLISLKSKLKLFPPLFFVAFFLGVLWVIALRSDLSISQRNLILPTGIFLLFLLVTIIYSKTKKFSYFYCFTILIISGLDLVRFGSKFTPFSSQNYFYPQTPTIKFLRSNLGYYRYMTTDRRILPPNAAIIYDLNTIDGYDPLYLKSYAQTITFMESGQPGTIASFNRILRPTNIDSPLIDQLAVKYVLSLTDIVNPKYQKVFQEGETRIYQNLTVKPLWQWQQDPSSTVEVLSYLPHQIILKVTTPIDQVITMAQMFYPGWQATVDSQPTPVFPAENNFLSLSIPAGTHHVIIWYQPKLFLL